MKKLTFYVLFIFENKYIYKNKGLYAQINSNCATMRTYFIILQA